MHILVIFSTSCSIVAHWFFTCAFCVDLCHVPADRVGSVGHNQTA